MDQYLNEYEYRILSSFSVFLDFIKFHRYIKMTTWKEITLTIQVSFSTHERYL